LDKHGWQWLEARKPKIVEGKPKFDRPETEAVPEKMFQIAELQKKGQLKPHREKDVLSTAMWSKEHGAMTAIKKKSWQQQRMQCKQSSRICSWQQLRSSSSQGYLC
jgi:hypothetical protein